MSMKGGIKKRNKEQGHWQWQPKWELTLVDE